MPDQHLPPPSWPTGPSSPDDGDSARPEAGDRSGEVPAAPPPPPAPPSPAPTTSPGNPWSAPGQDVPRQDTPGGWAPPPTPQRPGRRTWVIVLAVVVVIGVVGAIVGLLTADDADRATAGSSEAASDPAAEGDLSIPVPTPSGPRSTETGDLSRAEAEAHRDLFETIDESERTMLALNDDIAELSADATDQDLGAFKDAAAARAGELQDLHDTLLAIDDADSEDVAAIRDDYADHLQAWIDWAEALEGDPTLLDRPDAAGPYLQAINFTAEGFTSAVANNLDRSRVPDDVLDLADRIIDRGFTSEDGGTEI